ncbi:MAG TPA: 5-(carboxyamino)imidazole ribonucleotide synthase [Desulfobacterales bacterium]|nr:5-(carboxyamino)imidazole ribonucleotide synthase [Desulfobacterales bacterium]
MSLPLLPGTPEGVPVLGVLGGGQLGRMFVHAAQKAGYATAVLDPDAGSPAGGASQHHLRAPYTDTAALDELAALCVAVTTEFENVPAAALARLADRVPVSPSAAAVSICQHRAREKCFIEQAGVPCAPRALVESHHDLARVPASLFPGILKTATMGYDGKSQLDVQTAAALPAAWSSLGESPCVFERRLAIATELSVIVARGRDGQVVHLPVQQNLHRRGILAVTQVPAPDVSATLAEEAVAAARRLAAAMEYVGVLCVEFFALEDGRLVANEMAPRPHNSGHHSTDACDLSQFDLQVRTLTGLPLAEPRLHSPAVMINLTGDLWFPTGAAAAITPRWAGVVALPGVHLHLYGKAQPRPGRKMGHLTVTAPAPAEARCVALAAAALLGIETF